VRRWRQELNWYLLALAIAVLLCGLGFPQLPDHQAVRSPTPHKWEGNIRSEMWCSTFLPFALFDSDNHSFAIDIGDLQADSFRDTQPSRVAGGQNRAVLDVPHRTQKPKNFFWTGNNWQLLGFLGGWNDLRQAPILWSVIL
jgi:hypothetical protein